jgi:2,3-bisphosphoglycerate-dependent phosphoglycerate mutase
MSTSYVPYMAYGSDYEVSVGGGITHVYCSLQVRAVATATCIAEALDLPLVAWEDLHEMGGIVVRDEETGEGTGQPGRNRRYFETHYPDLILPATLGEAGWWNRPAEEREEVLPRAQRVLRELVERHGQTHDRVALVSHGGFYNYFLCALLGSTRRRDRWFVLNNAGVTRIDWVERGIRLVYLNRTDFLPQEMIT